MKTARHRLQQGIRRDLLRELERFADRIETPEGDLRELVRITLDDLRRGLRPASAPPLFRYAGTTGKKQSFR